MNKRRQIALNKVFNLFILLGIILGYVSALTFNESNIKGGLLLGAVAIFVLLISIMAPCCYLFDDKGITICYICLPNERYLWNNIRSITIESDDSHHIPFLSNIFRIEGRVEGEQRRYMDGKIRKSHRTKRLLEKYWDGTITGYLFEDAKNWWNKRKQRKNKKSRASKQYLTDEVSAMERKARDKTRNFLKPFMDQAKQQDFELQTQFYYMVGGDIFPGRPQEAYTYIALVKILDKSTSSIHTEFSVDLVHAHLGKNAYRGVKNENTLEELKFYITDILNNSSR